MPTVVRSATAGDAYVEKNKSALGSRGIIIAVVAAIVAKIACISQGNFP